MPGLIPSTPGLLPGRKGLLPARGCGFITCDGIAALWDRLESTGMYVTLLSTSSFAPPQPCDCLCGDTPTGTYLLEWDGVRTIGGGPLLSYTLSGSCGSCDLQEIRGYVECIVGGMVVSIGIWADDGATWVVTWGTPEPFPAGISLSGTLNEIGGSWESTVDRECDTTDGAEYLIP